MIEAVVMFFVFIAWVAGAALLGYLFISMVLMPVYMFVVHNMRRRLNDRFFDDDDDL